MCGCKQGTCPGNCACGCRHTPPVMRVETAGGSHIDPPLDPSWSDLEKLQWHAAVVTFDTGVAITVKPGRAWTNGIRLRSVYSVTTQHASTSAMSYRDCWTFLNGISQGASEVLGRG